MKYKIHHRIGEKTRLLAKDEDHRKNIFLAKDHKKKLVFQKIVNKTQILTQDCRKSAKFIKTLPKNAIFGKR